MKLKLFLLATSAVALASCSSDAVVEDNAAGNAIQFSATANQASRAADYYCNNALPADFHVWASVNGKQYFADEVYAKGTTESTKTTYSITGGVERYWPNEEISFFAAKNYDAFNWNVATASTMTITPALAAKDQKDLLYAYTVAKRGTGEAAKNFTEGKAKLNFRHALSQVVFYALNENSKIYVEIENISLNNAAATGTFTLPIGAANVTDDNLQDHTQAGAAETKGLGTWAVEGKAKFTADCKKDGNLVALTAEKQNLTDNATENDFGQSLLVLPEDVTAWDKTAITAENKENKGSYITVKCKIRNIAGTEVADDDVYLWGTKDAAQELLIPVNFNWEQGKKYIYTIKFSKTGHAGYDEHGNNVLIPIQFDVTVDDFAKAQESFNGTVDADNGN